MFRLVWGGVFFFGVFMGWMESSGHHRCRSINGRKERILCSPRMDELDDATMSIDEKIEQEGK